MLFNSIEFFIFLITVLILINCLRKSHYQQAILLGSSYLFYWTTGNYFVILLLFITIISFQSGEVIHHASNQIRKKIVLAIALVSLLIPLGFFKYYNFGIEIIHQIPLPLNYYLNLPVLGLILPIGISFFTFSAISYVVDIYRGTIQPEKKFYKYALFVSYFPHLLAGPIVRAGQFLPQLKNHISLSPGNLKTGVTIMVWGFVKKFVIADNCAPFVNTIFANPTSLSSPYIVIGTLLFGIQIYCDFSGYIDIALGIAELIGLHLPQNFFRPYLSKNPTEFWRRWNITLSSFIKDYVYIPLGGNRKGKIRTYFNLEISMLLCGLWHGAAWNFVIWGGYHGVLLSFHKFVAKRAGSFPKLLPPLNDHFKIFVKILVTQYFIFLGWIMFRVGNLSDMIYCVNKYVLFDFDFSYKHPSIFGITTIIGVINGVGLYIKIFAVIAIVIAVVLILHTDYVMKKIIYILTTDWTQFIVSLRLKYWIVCLTIMILTLLCFAPSASPVFIYYQF
jgi:alginate O-acetyltransferase complex protein AlgI